MKPKQISLSLILLYIAIAVPLIYNLISFPNEILETMDQGVTTTATKDLVYHKTWTLNLYVIVELSLGLLGMLYLTQRLLKGNIRLTEQVSESKQLDFKSKNKTKQEAKKESKTEIEPEFITKLKTILKPNLSPEAFLSSLAETLELSQAAWYSTKINDEKRWLSFNSGYAYFLPDGEEINFKFGEGLPGQAAKSQKTIHLDNFQSTENQIFSGLGKGSPKTLLLIPYMVDDVCMAVLELASFRTISKEEVKALAQIEIKNIPALLSPSTHV